MNAVTMLAPSAMDHWSITVLGLIAMMLTLYWLANEYEVQQPIRRFALVAVAVVACGVGLSADLVIMDPCGDAWLQQQCGDSAWCRFLLGCWPWP